MNEPANQLSRDQILSRLPSLAARFLIVAGLLLAPVLLQAQDMESERYTFQFRGDNLSDALNRIAAETGKDLLYDPQLTRDIAVYSQIRELPFPELLVRLLEGTGLDYLTLSSGTVVIVKRVTDSPAFGSFAGRIIDRQSGEPLPGATVLLADASGGTSTTRTGSFHMNRMVSGSYRIIFSYLGYEPVTKTIDIHPDEQTREVIGLEPKPVSFHPIVVTSHLPQLPHQNGSGETASSESEWVIGNSLRDAVRSLNLFSGVQHGISMTDLHLQGGQHGEHRLLLDGAPVYNPYSFGQMYSAFSPFAIRSIEVHKAGYGPEAGSQISGLINLNHEIPEQDRTEGMIHGDPLSLNSRVNLSIPSGGESPVNVMAAGRTNYWSIYQAPFLKQALRKWDDVDPLITHVLLHPEGEPPGYQTLEHSPDIQFHDLHLAARFESDPFNRFEATLYNGGNYVNTDLLAQRSEARDFPEYMYASDRYRWKNFMGQFAWHTMPTSRLDLSLRTSYSTNSLGHRYRIGNTEQSTLSGSNTTLLTFSGQQSTSASTIYDTFREHSSEIPVQEDHNRIRHFIARADLTYSFSPGFQAEGGLRADRVTSEVDFSELFYLATRSTEESTLLSSWINGRVAVGNYWTFNLGSRFTWHSSTETLYPEPRASIQLDRPDLPFGYGSFRISGGLYRQFINQYQITNAGPTSLVPSFSVWSHNGIEEPPKAWHLSGSIYLEPGNRTTVTLEAFHKWQPVSYITSYENLVTGVQLSRTGFQAFAEATSMQAYGAGIRIRQDLPDPRFQLMLGYDYSMSMVDMESQFGRTLPAPWNEPHRFQARALARIHPAITLVAKWETVAGRSWGFRRAYYDYLRYQYPDPFGRFTFSRPDQDKLPPFHQLDLSIIYRPELSHISPEIRLDLINLLHHNNIVDRSLHPEPGGRYSVRERTFPGFTPSLSIQLRF
ncbi:MAG: carboxypeptidase-like regulatory domain-containing protein [Balneolaceae bacterium]